MGTGMQHVHPISSADVLLRACGRMWVGHLLSVQLCWRKCVYVCCTVMYDLTWVATVESSG